ncbi:MAG: CHAT domain-containing protein, partial [Ignavibacteriaceae bacterium]
EGSGSPAIPRCWMPRLSTGKLAPVSAVPGVRAAMAVRSLKQIRTKTGQYGLTQVGNIQDLYLAKIFINRNETNKAIQLLSRVVSTSTSISDYNTQIEAGYLLAQIYVSAKNDDEALKHFNQTINLIEELSRPLFGNPEIQIFHFSSYHEIFASFAEYLYDTGKEEEAFEIIERSRSRNTLQNLNNIKITSAIDDEELLYRLYDLDWMIRNGFYDQSELTGIQKEYDNLKTKIISADPSISKYINNVFGESYKNIIGKLSKEENIVTLSVGIHSTQVFLISKDKFISKKIPLGKEEIKIMLSEIAPIFSDDTNSDGLYYNQDLFAFNAQASFRLFMELFEPVIKEIPEGENIVFNLPYELALLPAEFLVTETDESGSPYYYNDKKFLIDKYPVTYTPSVSVYLFQKEKQNSDNKTILLVGDPQIDNSDFSLSYRGGLLEDDSFNSRNIVLFPLQYSRDEIENVNTLIDNGYVLTSGNATEDNFKQNASLSKIIHLSTHSFLYKDQPLIMFSQDGDSQEDGYLESSEILQLELQSDLVVLSSCKSGLGKIDEAEGIIGMQKSFFEAGAKSIIVSLWDVNDKYTSYFMKSFYSYLSDGDDKNVALRKAKLYFKDNYSANPYYWAAFVLSGDPYGVELQKSSGSSFLRTILILGLLTAVVSIFLFRKRKVA